MVAKTFINCCTLTDSKRDFGIVIEQNSAQPISLARSDAYEKVAGGSASIDTKF